MVAGFPMKNFSFSENKSFHYYIIDYLPDALSCMDPFKFSQNLVALRLPLPQWHNRLARGSYKQMFVELVRGCDFEPHLEQKSFSFLYEFYILATFFSYVKLHG